MGGERELRIAHVANDTARRRVWEAVREEEEAGGDRRWRWRASERADEMANQQPTARTHTRTNEPNRTERTQKVSERVQVSVSVFGEGTQAAAAAMRWRRRTNEESARAMMGAEAEEVVAHHRLEGHLNIRAPFRPHNRNSLRYRIELLTWLIG